MPFDSGSLSPVQLKIRALVDLLRHPEQWPDGFVWDYSRATCCAMGLAAWVVWDLGPPPRVRPMFIDVLNGDPVGRWIKPTHDDIVKALGVNAMRRIFINLGHRTTASDVADELDALVV